MFGVCVADACGGDVFRCASDLAESGGLISNSLFNELADWEDELQRVFEDNPALFEDRPEPCVSDLPSLNGGPS